MVIVEILSDSKGVMDTIRHLTLEDALWYIALDELVEITPKSIRIRKNSWLSELEIRQKND